MSSMHECPGNLHGGSHTLVKDVNEFVPVISIFLNPFGSNLVSKILM
jgi:pantothenate synthetase